MKHKVFIKKIMPLKLLERKKTMVYYAIFLKCLQPQQSLKLITYLLSGKCYPYNQ